MWLRNAMRTVRWTRVGVRAGPPVQQAQHWVWGAKIAKHQPAKAAQRLMPLGD